jgi:hypothetical protein
VPDGLVTGFYKHLQVTRSGPCAGYERQRRHATLVAVSLDLSTSLTDQAIDLFGRLVGAMFRKAEDRQARAFQADARAINEKVRLYARVGVIQRCSRAGRALPHLNAPVEVSLCQSAPDGNGVLAEVSSTEGRHLSEGTRGGSIFEYKHLFIGTVGD